MSDADRAPPGPFRRPATGQAASAGGASSSLGGDSADTNRHHASELGHQPARERPAERRTAAAPEAYAPPPPDAEDNSGAVGEGSPLDPSASLAVTAAAVRSEPRSPWLMRAFLGGIGLLGAAFLAWLIEQALAAIGTGSLTGLLLTGALALLSAALLGVLFFELQGLARLRSVTRVRAQVEAALANERSRDMDRALSALTAMHSAREPLAWTLSRFRDAVADTPDARDRLALYERMVLAPLDQAALAEVRRMARRSALLTAASPNMLLDAAITLWLNISVVRRVAAVHGLRPGFAGSLALLQRTATALAAAIGMEAAHDIVPEALAGGILRTFARRAGEGAVNGLLTIRIGLATLEATRPMPFTVLQKPSTAALARQTIGA